MVLLKRLRAFYLLLLLCSCAKLSYMTEQGWGQLKLLTNSKKNIHLLEDPKLAQKDKDKIKKVEKYKEYFYQYWQREASDIYSETVLLDRDAVTYLVIASKPNKIEAKKECFPLAGCFPYLGFFKKSSAIEYKKVLEKEGNDTYMRRVLAYSTLGTFDDPILSTFFLYDDFELAETVFHELFHTIFFVKDDVDLNENLANFFGKAMVYEYFGKSHAQANKHFKNIERSRKLSQKIAAHAKNLKVLLASEGWHQKKNDYINDIFMPDIKKECQKLKVAHCWPFDMKWNSATFAAFMTYESGQEQIELFMQKFKGNLRDLFSFIQKSYEDYKKQSKIKSFETYLLKGTHATHTISRSN